ncbi:MAG TPA: alginate lyase family protein [bacterium]|nr:alginate lyase family protein [bacterium]
MGLAAQAKLVIRRDGWRAFFAKGLAFVGRKAEVPFLSARDRLINTWPARRDLPAPETLCSPRPPFLVDPATLPRRVDAFRRRCPQAAERLLAQADAALNNRFDLLGLGEVFVGETIDWRRDFVHDVRFPVRNFRRQNYVRGDGSDVKVPWELARLQHLPLLALAWRMTGDDKYALRALAHVEDFCRYNKPRFGIHWACPMEIGLRAFSVGLTATILADRLADEPRRRAKILRLMEASAAHIEQNLEYDPNLTSNHYLGDLLGLLAAAIAFPELPHSERRREFAVREFRQEMEKQFDNNGVNFEASLPYHRLSLEIMTAAYLLCRGCKLELGLGFQERLRAAYRFVSAACYPDGTVPLIGDNDSGRVLKLLGRADNQMHYLCELGTALFGEDLLVLPIAEPDPEVYWWLDGQVDRLEQARPRPARHRAFTEAGRFFLETDEAKLAFVAGPVGQNGNGGHAHNDALSFTYFAQGREIVADPGTYVYTASAEWRNRLRSTAAHSTVRVDEAEINPFAPELLFTLTDHAQARGDMEDLNEGYLELRGRHRGYRRLAEPVELVRLLRCYPSGSVRVSDEFLTAGEHRYEQRLVLAPGVEGVLFAGARKANELLGRIQAPTSDYWQWVGLLSWAGGAVHLLSGGSDDHWQVEPGWSSAGYGRKEPVQILVRRWRQLGAGERSFALIL